MKKEVVGRPYVMCSEAEIEPDYNGRYKSDQSAEYRRLVFQNEENGVFGTDDPFYAIHNPKPCVVINEPFSICRSEHFPETVFELNSYICKELKEKDKYTKEEKMALSAKSTQYENIWNSILYRGEDRSLRIYPCILELIDSWFNPSDKVYLNNYMDCLDQIDRLKTDLINKQRSLKVELDKGFQKIVIEPNWELDEMENEKVKKLQVSYSHFVSIYNSWILKKEIYSISDTDYLDNSKEINEEISVVTSALDALIKEALAFKSLAENYGKEAFKPFYDCLIQLKSQFSELSKSINEIKENKYPVINMNSYLMCRCGGIIRIVSSGESFKTTKEHLQKNLIVILKHAEKNINKQIENVKNKYAGKSGNKNTDIDKAIRKAFEEIENPDDKMMRLGDWLGAIGALRIVQKVLHSMGEEAEEEEYREIDVPEAKIRIYVKSVADAEELDHSNEALKGIASVGAAIVGHPEVGLFFDAMSGLDWLTHQASYGWEDEVEVETRTTGEKVRDAVGTAIPVGADAISTAIAMVKLFAGCLGQVLSNVDFANNFIGYTWSVLSIAENLSYRSYDTDSYRIEMHVITYAKTYYYEEDFDPEGNKIRVETMNVAPTPYEFTDLSSLSYEETEIAYCLYGEKETIMNLESIDKFMEGIEDDD